MFPHRRQPSSSPAPRRARVGRTARTSRSQPARRARLLTRRAKLNAARRPRRGVLLLVVLSLLVLFMMVGTAFIITAKQSEKVAKSTMKSSARLAGEAAQTQLLDEVLLQVLRDTNNPNSSLRFHSLLGDMYGNDGLKGVIDSTTLPRFAGVLTGGPDLGPTGGQMLEFNVSTTAGFLKDFHGNSVDAAGVNLALSHLDNAYNGQVLTFLTGIAKGRSTRIVGFTPPNTFRVMNVRLQDGSLITDPRLLTSAANPTRILINGRPFSGTGVGLNLNARPDQPQLTAREVVAGIKVAEGGSPRDPLLALLPNAVFFNPTATTIETAQSDTTNGVINYLPNYNLASGGFVDWNGRGGANESYDAPDFQNMALGMLSDKGSGRKEFEDPTSGTPDLDEVGIPSFHRPDLLYWWRAQFPTTGTDGIGSKPMLLRKILMRPNWIDHQNFTGSNPEFAAILAQFKSGAVIADEVVKRTILGPWDVDNDNDGFRDSIWVDVGLPVMAGPNGKLVKPLAAILVIDMDGKLNVNAAGSCDLADAWQATGAGTGLEALTGVYPTGTRLAGTSKYSITTPRGVGYGPADISLKPALNPNPLPDPPNFTWLLTGHDFGSGVTFPGRYGYANGPLGVVRPGIAGRWDILSQVALNGWPTTARVLSSFATPPDLRARYGNGLNAIGQPVYDATMPDVVADASDSLTYDSPYEFNLSQRTAAGVQANAGVNSTDAPFSVAEMERALRLYDADAGSLPPRLAMLSGIIGGGSPDLHDRLRITTDSFDLPAPNIALPHELISLISTDVNYRRPPRSAAELLEVRVRRGLGIAEKFPEPLLANDAIRVRNVIRRLLAPELANGLRIDVNRAFGNGRDDNNNGIVDEPGEFVDVNNNGVYDPGATPSEDPAVWSLMFDGVTPTTAEADYATPRFPRAATELVPTSGNLNDPAATIKWVDHRHMMARHLYVTALTLTADDNYDGSTVQQQELARRIAQWAVNVVDFRDPDNIMTPFEYDVNPFNGWDVDGYVGAAPGPDGVLGTADDVASPDDALPVARRGLVWGVERPELVITESAAWHDRRTLDEANETPDPAEGDGQEQGTVFSTDPMQDASFDQGVRPRGAWFLELYNPWPAIGSANADTHAVQPPPFPVPPAGTPRYDLGVDLTATDKQTGRSPIWRIAVYKTDPSNPQVLDPDDPEPLRRPDRTDFERSVYFTDFDPDYDGDGAAFFSQTSRLAPSVRPGRYMVVGAGRETGPNSKIYESPIGDLELDAPAGTMLRKVVLNANDNPPYAVQLLGDDGAAQNSGGTPSFAVQSPNLSQHPEVAEFPNGSAVTEGDPLNRTSLSDVAIINRAINPDTNSPETRRLTLTEPANGYPSAVGDSVWSPTSNSVQSDGEGEYIDQFNNPKPIDIPLDDNREDGETRLSTIGQVDNFRVVYLQRLANPMLPWNPIAGDPEHVSTKPVNPYMTIDHMSTNVTVFNGKAGNPNLPGFTEPILGQQCDNFDAMERIASMQRGKQNDPRPGRANLWSPEEPGERRVTRPVRDTHTHVFEGIPDVTLGFLNRELMDTAPTLPDPNGVRLRMQPPTATPFPWLTWNNRPYISGNELMMVPRARSSQLLRYFSMNNAGKPYDAQVPQQPEDERLQLPFGHLVNFFLDDESAPEFAPKHLHRLLEFVHTPSLFAGTETFMNPGATRFGQNVDPTTMLPDDPRLRYLPPFNKFSEFRDPGRVNLNTIAGEEVWAGLFHGNPTPTPSGHVHPGPPFGDFVAARRGVAGSMLQFDSASPSFFGNPFRSPDAGDLVPLDSMRRAGVDCGLLRSVNPSSGSSGPSPLFAADTKGAGHEFRDSERNPYYQFQPMIRLDNLVTGRSNVYAMWVTIGFFEVEDAPTKADFAARNGGIVDPQRTELYNRVYPDGYAFTREDGVDVGNVRRLRGFYIIDRTKMAGFEPGADHNVEETVRLRRRIE